VFNTPDRLPGTCPRDSNGCPKIDDAETAAANAIATKIAARPKKL
jgi:hypothetical protein